VVIRLQLPFTILSLLRSHKGTGTVFDVVIVGPHNERESLGFRSLHNASGNPLKAPLLRAFSRGVFRSLPRTLELTAA